MEQGITRVDRAYLIGYFDCVSFAVFRSAVTLEALQALDDNHMRLVPRFGKVATVAVAEGNLELPPQPVRAESARLMRLRAPTQLCSCSVVEAAGFTGAAARGVLTAIQVLSFHAYPLHTTRTLPEAAAWTATNAKRNVDWATQLAHFIESSRTSDKLSPRTHVA